MKQLLVAGSAAAVLLSGCATTGLRSNNAGDRTFIGAAAGAALGALGGLAVGSNALNGAVVGAVAGGALGAAVPGKVFEGRQYYRDTRGYCYYVDRDGRPQYDGTVSC